MSNSLEIVDTTVVATGLAQLRNGLYSDVTLTAYASLLGSGAIGDGSKTSFGAHRAVLSVHSGYFRGLFQGGFADSDRRVVATESSDTVLSLMLDFIYTGRVTVPSTSVLQLVHEVEFYQVEALRNQLVNHLSVAVDADSVLPCLAYSLDFQHDNLQQACKGFVLRNADMVLPAWTALLAAAGESADDVARLDQAFVRSILASDDLQVGEEAVLAFVVQLVLHCKSKPTLPQIDFGSCAEVIRFGLIPQEFLDSIATQSGLFSLEKAQSLRTRTAAAANSRPRLAPLFRWQVPCAAGLAVSPYDRFTVTRVAGMPTGDVTALSTKRPASDSGRRYFEISVSKTKSSIIFVGLMDTSRDADSEAADSEVLYSFQQQGSYSLDLSSGSIFIAGEVSTSFLPKRVPEGGRVGLLHDLSSGNVSVYVDGKLMGRAFSGLLGSYSFAVTMSTIGDEVALTQAPCPAT